MTYSDTPHLDVTDFQSSPLSLAERQIHPYGLSNFPTYYTPGQVFTPFCAPHYRTKFPLATYCVSVR